MRVVLRKFCGGCVRRVCVIPDSTSVSMETGTAQETLTERRIARLTLVFGGLAGAAAASLHAWGWAAGLLIGAALGWINFRWLRRGVDALVLAATAQAGAEKPQPPPGAPGRMLLRYALIGLCAYVIFRYLRIPFASMAVGLCALGAAAMAASVCEILRPVKPGS